MKLPIDVIHNSCADINICLDDLAISRLETYAQLLVEWNEKINLTAIVDPLDIAIKHFVDCMMFFKYIEIPTASSLIDIGTGAGFPGIVLKIVRPDIKITLLDSLNKRLVFLEEVLSQLNLCGKIVHSRAEDGSKTPLRESFDFATARAVASMPVLCEYCLPYVKIGGSFVAMKGPSAEKELLKSNAVELLGGTTARFFNCCLPDQSSRCFVKIKKISQTPIKYPRNPSKIQKQPL